MARPIEPTPILKKKDAERLHKDLQGVSLSRQQKETLDKCSDIYHKFYQRINDKK